MKQFKSKTLTIARPAEVAYALISEFDRFGPLMPKEVINWKNEGDHCSFTIKGMADIEMDYAERTPYTGVKMKSTKSPFPFVIHTILNILDKNSCESTVVIEANLNSMLALIAGGPLQNLTGLINTKLKEECEKGRDEK